MLARLRAAISRRGVRLDCGRRDARFAAVVVTASVGVPEPSATAAGLNEQVCTRVTTGAMLQIRFTALLNPPVGAIAIVAVDDTPAETEAGVSAEASEREVH